MFERITSWIRLMLLRRAITRCRANQLLVFSEPEARLALVQLGALLDLLGKSGFLHDVDGRPRKLHLTRKLDRHSAIVRSLFQEAQAVPMRLVEGDTSNVH